jgi:hypothetical protein
MNTHDHLTLETLEARLTALLPQEYQDSYQDIEPVPMGSAGLKYGEDGKVAWNEIWQSFCDLAMAGGPPHKGQLLVPASPERIAEQPGRYEEVVGEMCRGIAMVTGLPVEPSARAGWITVACDSDGMAGWLLRAIVMENVSAHAEEAMLDLPAGPDYRIDKEIKNVVTVIAKTCHYWSGHMWRFEQRAIGELFAAMSHDSPLVVPALAADIADDGRAYDGVADALRAAGVTVSPPRYRDWAGVECQSIRAAVWMMRMLVACNILARREETSLFVPVNPASDPGGTIVAASVALVRRLAADKGVT